MTNGRTFCFKVAYKTADKAQKAMRSRLKRGPRKKRDQMGKIKMRNDSGRNIEIYKCNLCQKYHWGHKSNIKKDTK